MACSVRRNGPAPASGPVQTSSSDWFSRHSPRSGRRSTMPLPRLDPAVGVRSPAMYPESRPPGSGSGGAKGALNNLVARGRPVVRLAGSDGLGKELHDRKRQDGCQLTRSKLRCPVVRPPFSSSGTFLHHAVHALIARFAVACRWEKGEAVLRHRLGKYCAVQVLVASLARSFGQEQTGMTRGAVQTQAITVRMMFGTQRVGRA